ncbi:MAG: hypothetical protein A2297_00835 [Elusimicrobia bacterium RIFOXYB2_FULL_48_7]|nr:MAG: hypothetical protein A2297_00835 [Elusimicrobia bacterium RIFOXYB2_FULL_48_7]
MQEINLPSEKLIELGDRHQKDNDHDNAIRYYKKALIIEPENTAIFIKLAEAYTSKASGNSSNYQFAMDYYRDIIRLEPGNELAHHKLVFLAMKNKQLGELAAEYREKLQKNPDNAVYKNCLQQISTLALFDKEITKHDYASRYRPTLVTRIMFDFLLMPTSIVLMFLSIFNSMFKGMFLQSFTLLMFYAAYRAVIYLIQKS